ncbi:MAG: corrinoid protein [Paracoccaceae bacterium]|nr:corrinoid protein [Paracoccaceae bacterium]
MTIEFETLAQAIVDGDADTALALVQDGLGDQKNPDLDELANAKEILNKGLIGGMDIISELWIQEKIFIPEVLISAKVMHGCMDHLRPILEASNEPPRGICVIGTVKGDLHDIGQNIVGMMLKGNGFEVHNIGPNSSPEKFADKVRETGANLIGLSALLTTTMPMQRESIKYFEEEGLLETAAVMVGGAPVTADWAEKIDSDGYAPDAATTVGLAKQLVDDLAEELGQVAATN